jgi:hypothetical protein
MRKMKTKLLIILCVMIFAGTVMVGPVAGAGSVANVTGNPTNYMSINEAGDITNWALTEQFLNENLDSCKLNVTTNRQGWSVTVTDALDEGKTIQPGKMVQYTTGSSTYGSKYLATAMEMDGLTVSGQYSVTKVEALDGTQKTLFTGDPGLLGTGTWGAIPIYIRQFVTHGDESLPTGQVYRIVVTFTGVHA